MPSTSPKSENAHVRLSENNVRKRSKKVGGIRNREIVKRESRVKCGARVEQSRRLRKSSDKFREKVEWENEE